MRQPTEELIEKYHTLKKEFDSSEHIRAWLIRVVINKAKNISKRPWRPYISLMRTVTFFIK